jgi:diguanylate cyclase (GGDEF)-like protein/PAS domain S-box-containing protein
MLDNDIAAGEKHLLLLVDDLPSNLHVLISALKHGYRLKTATSGQDALAILEQQDDLPKLVVLDVKMPGMSGIEVLRRMRLDPRMGDIPVVLLSADGSEQTEISGIHVGADDYLVKPVSANVLNARVRSLIQRNADRLRLRLAAHVFDYSGEGIVITDRSNRIVDVNAAFTQLTGYGKAEVLGKDPKLLSSGRTTLEEYRAMWNAIANQGFWQGELWDRRKCGKIFPKMMTISVVRDRTGAIEYHLANFVDISHFKEAQRHIEHLAHHDPLTGLPNRLHAQIYLEQTLLIAKRMAEQIAVLFLDLDRFKHINDTLGHSVGDELLIQVAARLKTCVRQCDLVARLGGDEFVVVLRSREIAAAASSVAQKICKQIGRPFKVGPHSLHTASSVGISIYPQNAEHIDDLMRHADMAMYHAKSEGGGGFHFFSEHMNRHAHEKLELEGLLHQAVELRQFELYYQPQLALPGRKAIGAEALLRWRHPEKGFIPPGVFIPLAESTNLIFEIGEWVLEVACRQAGQWLRAGLPFGRIGVNISARQFQNARLYDSVRGLLEETGLPPDCLELEITETAVAAFPEQAGETLRLLRGLGIHVAMDDFGTGYSSLAQLEGMPLDRLKIDASFVRDIGAGGTAKSGVIAAAVIGLAHNLGLKVVAEGVETEAHLAFLLNHRCDEAQGHYFARPMPKEAFERFIQAQAGAGP